MFFLYEHFGDDSVEDVETREGGEGSEHLDDNDFRRFHSEL
jgi:hypothetical protein